MIEVIDGQFHRVLLRPWPKILVGPEVLWFGKWLHQRRHGDRLLLYYNQPWRFPNFLALAYALSARETSMRSIRVGLEVLDEIARLKKSDALLCDVGNWRISERFMQRGAGNRIARRPGGIGTTSSGSTGLIRPGRRG